MKLNNIIHALLLLAILISDAANAELPSLTGSALDRLPSSPLTSHPTISPLSCKADAKTNGQATFTQQKSSAIPVSLEYLNDRVKVTYSTMRNGVIAYVTKKVALSLLNFSIDSFSAENIANYVSEGTRPYLPFEFANGVKITKVTPKGSTIIYRAEMPINRSHNLASPLALAGKASASTTICTDMKMVDDLLGRDIVIRYDYFDSSGVFFSSFTING